MSITFNDTETMRNASPLLASDNVLKQAAELARSQPEKYSIRWDKEQNNETKSSFCRLA